MKSSTQASFLLFLGCFADLVAHSFALQSSSQAHGQVPKSALTSTEAQLRTTSTRKSTVITVPDDTEARCLDGSPYRLSIVYGNADHWTIRLGSGGQCTNTTECELQIEHGIGSSVDVDWEAVDQECECENIDEFGNDIDCTCVTLPYCDGGYYTGYVKEPVKSPTGTDLYIRGRRNFRESIKILVDEYGMGNATNVLLQGLSSGGLSTILNLDRLAKIAPDQVMIHGKPESAFTIAHKTSTNASHLPKEDDYYMKILQSVYSFHDSEEAVNGQCVKDFKTSPWYCMVGSVAANYVETPMFILNSHYDPWQLTTGIFGLNRKAIWEEGAATAELLPDVLQYGEDWLNVFQEFVDYTVAKGRPHGAYIQSCLCHGNCRSIKNSYYEGHPLASLFGQWYNGLNKGYLSLNNGKPPIYFDRNAPNYDCPFPDTSWAKFGGGAGSAE